MSQRACGAEEARQNLPELLLRAGRGEVTIVTKHGKPCAAIVPIDAIPRPRRGLSMLDLEGSAEGLGLWGADPAAWVASLRDEWS